MEPWQITQKPAYLNDFVDLSKTQQQAVVAVLRELARDPLTPRGNTIKKMKGYTNVYRYRLGDFRLLYAAAPEARMINLLAVGPRGSIYKRFDFPGWDAPESAVAFGPELAQQPEWLDHPEWFKPQPANRGDKLPRKLTPAQLRKWRIDPQYDPVLMRCLYEDDLLNLPEHKVPPAVIGRVLEALYPATVDQLAAQPDQRLFNPEDLTRYAEGTLAGFLLQLDAQQEPLTHWALSGPTLVKGGPGSGKSTVALYRLREIMRRREESGDSPQILFTTYTNALINASSALLQQLLAEITGRTGAAALPDDLQIMTMHKIAVQILQECGRSFMPASEGHRQEALRLARAALRPRSFADAQKLALFQAVAPLRDNYLLTEFEWVIAGQNCSRQEDYLTAVRVGRGMPLTALQRQGVWALYRHFREQLAVENRLTWSETFQAALALVREGTYKRRWDYLFVDEAQDLPPAALALAVELCRSPAGLFLTADANQSLYNRGFHWRIVHDKLRVRGRTRILGRNYRSTRQIAQAAAGLMTPPALYDREALTQEYQHSGPRPQLYAAAGSADQAAWIGRHIVECARKLRLPVNAAAVLVNAASVGRPLAQALRDQGLPATFMNSREFDLDETGIKVTTLHAAKGLEFPIVVVAHVEAGRLPREIETTDAEELAAHLRAERQLLFVGCTRAMRNLFVTYDRQLPSPFIADLQAEYWETGT